MKWEDGKRLKSRDGIEEFEKFAGYKFPESFIKFIMKNDGAYAADELEFDTKFRTKLPFSNFASFDKDSSDSIWEYLENFSDQLEISDSLDAFDDFELVSNIYNNYIIFADEACGDWIAFKKSDSSVVYISHETYETEKIADTFDEFLDSLRSLSYYENANKRVFQKRILEFLNVIALMGRFYVKDLAERISVQATLIEEDYSYDMRCTESQCSMMFRVNGKDYNAKEIAEMFNFDNAESRYSLCCQNVELQFEYIRELCEDNNKTVPDKIQLTYSQSDSKVLVDYIDTNDECYQSYSFECNDVIDDYDTYEDKF